MFAGVTGFFVIIAIIMILLTLATWLGKLSQSGLTMTRWFLLSMGALILLWGLYNTLGARLGLWQPISFDQYLKPLSDALERLINWIWETLAKLVKH